MFRTFLTVFRNKNESIKIGKIISRHNSTSIFALASGFNQRCGVAVVRLSGKSTKKVLLKLTKKNSVNDFEPRKMYLKDLWHPKTNEKIDKSLIVWFKEPNSFTGEDVCEFHVHGGPAVISSLMSALSSFEDVRYAEPGEFSRRAFLNERMDLVEIEGLVDLVNAETEMQRKQALQQMEGSLSKIYKKWRQEIIKCLANVEAFIDFNEEENVEDNVLDEVEIKVKDLIKTIENHLNDNRKGERLRNGVRVAIIGQPNAGKSSLLNSLCKRPAAIVSPIPGTTRDIIESALNIGGYPIVLSDTAGLRDTSDLIELEGVKRALNNVKSSDILIIVIDVRKHYEVIIKKGFENFLKDHLNENLKLKIFSNTNEEKMDIKQFLTDKEIIISLNKKDLLDKNMIELLNTTLRFENVTFADDKKCIINKISCLNDSNSEIQELLEQLESKVSNLCSNGMSEMPSLTQQRHRDMLIKCLNCLKSYLYKKDQEQDFALIAEELRLAVKWLGTITGHVTTEQILDVIFRDFCIGK